MKGTFLALTALLSLHGTTALVQADPRPWCHEHRGPVWIQSAPMFFPPPTVSYQQVQYQAPPVVRAQRIPSYNYERERWLADQRRLEAARQEEARRAQIRRNAEEQARLQKLREQEARVMAERARAAAEAERERLAQLAFEQSQRQAVERNRGVQEPEFVLEEAPSPPPIQETREPAPPEHPTARPHPSRTGVVFSPFDPDGEDLIDVKGLEPGSLAVDPRTNNVFRVPAILDF